MSECLIYACDALYDQLEGRSMDGYLPLGVESVGSDINKGGDFVLWADSGFGSPSEADARVAA